MLRCWRNSSSINHKTSRPGNSQLLVQDCNSTFSHGQRPFHCLLPLPPTAALIAWFTMSPMLFWTVTTCPLSWLLLLMWMLTVMGAAAAPPLFMFRKVYYPLVEKNIAFKYVAPCWGGLGTAVTLAGARALVTATPVSGK